MRHYLNSILNFNLCFFLSLVIASILPSAISSTPLILILSNVLICTTICVIINKELLISAIIASILAPYITYNSYITYIISAIVIIITILNIKIFMQKVHILLQPNSYIIHTQVRYFVKFFFNLIVSFSVFNLSLNKLHTHLTSQKAFNFGEDFNAVIDSLYYTIITMTTVGYGEIYPHTSIAKVVISLECIVSYIMFGLMIGIISKGIKSPQ